MSIDRCRRIGDSNSFNKKVANSLCLPRKSKRIIVNCMGKTIEGFVNKKKGFFLNSNMNNLCKKFKSWDITPPKTPKKQKTRKCPGDQYLKHYESKKKQHSINKRKSKVFKVLNF
ncbi:hypothetical protein ACFL2K_01870 [Candidatus Margulisiibacteriota bacterium]